MNYEEKLEGLCNWVKTKKGITKIDLFDLIGYLPEYEEWLVANKKEWLSNSIKCDLCGNSWVAVYHISSTRLECPNCRNMVMFEITKQ